MRFGGRAGTGHRHRVGFRQVIKQSRASDKICLFEDRGNSLQSRNSKEVVAVQNQLIAGKHGTQATLGMLESIGIEIQQGHNKSCPLVAR